jgi:hypothetical protein
MLALLQEVPQEVPGPVQKVLDFLDTPAPYSPFSEYLLVLFILWWVARRAHRPKPDFSAQAQEVLDEKFKKGEIDKTTYDKYRQELSMRIKKE